MAAGCRCVHVPDLGPVSLEVQARADRIYRGLPDLMEALERGDIVLG
jgi:hypothetical protein